jgi:hypothetical protein
MSTCANCPVAYSERTSWSSIALSKTASSRSRMFARTTCSLTSVEAVVNCTVTRPIFCAPAAVADDCKAGAGWAPGIGRPRARTAPSRARIGRKVRNTGLLGEVFKAGDVS